MDQFRNLLCCIVVIFFWSGIALAETPTASVPPRSVAIGLMASLSGDAALIGKQCQDGFNQAQSDFAPGGMAGAVSLHFITADHKGDGRTAVTEFHRLVDVENVMAIVTHYSQATMQINPLSKQKQLPLLSAVAHSEFTSSNPFAFRFFPSAQLESGALDELLRRWNIARPALLTVQDEYALSLRTALVQRLAERKIEPIADLEIVREDTDLNSTVTKLLAKRPDLVFLNVAIPQLVPIAKKLKSGGFKGRLAGNVWLAFQNTQELARSGELDGAAFAMLDSAGMKRSEAEVENILPPAQYACYTALAALLQSVAAIEGPVNRNSIFEALTKIKSVRIPGESVPLANRELLFRLKIAVYKDGVIAAE